MYNLDNIPLSEYPYTFPTTNYGKFSPEAMISSADQHQSLLTIAEAATLLNVSKITIRRWTNDGKLPCLRVGPRKERRFRESDLRNLLASDQRALPKVSTERSTNGGTHRCVLCDQSEHGWQAVLAEFIQQAESGSHVTLVADSAHEKNLSDSLRAHGYNLNAISATKQFRQLSLEESYLLSGNFSGSRAAEFVESTILYGRALGFEHTLFVGWSDWLPALENYQPEEIATEVLVYERHLEAMINRYPGATVLCPYSLPDLEPTLIRELTSLHTQLQFETKRVYSLGA